MNNISFEIKKHIKTYKDWPHKGSTFRDLTDIYKHPEITQKCVNRLAERYICANLTHIAILEARAFILGSMLAARLNLPIILIRKPHKMAGDILQSHEDSNIRALQMLKNSCGENDNILIFDDLIAKGNSTMGAINLIKQTGANINEVACLVCLPDLNGIQNIGTLNVPVFHLCAFEGI
ncbi:MAG: purine phosphoribosyltransferase family protein [Saccharospirillaceae bacterium]|nr:purine phosphoribosyltransferase family protein [Pseudomonadales bacterium]NRB79040.1 purine phosphoribosyltransferase family protein [Saccharospirillaceae bacterium]